MPPNLQAIQDSIFGHTSPAYVGRGGTAGGTITGAGGVPGGGTANYGAGWHLGQALANHLTNVGGGGVWNRPSGPGGGPTGPPVMPPGLPAGFPDLQALIDYMRGQSSGMY